MRGTGFAVTLPAILGLQITGNEVVSRPEVQFPPLIKRKTRECAAGWAPGSECTEAGSS